MTYKEDMKFQKHLSLWDWQSSGVSARNKYSFLNAIKLFLLEIYQCHMILISVYLHKYLVIIYLSKLGKNIKENQRKKV